MKLKENDTIMSSEVFIFESGEPVKKDILEILKDISTFQFFKFTSFQNKEKRKNSFFKTLKDVKAQWQDRHNLHIL